MNKNVTSKAELLAEAKAIVLEEGVEQLNIRYLAQKKGIALGSVYNYFPSKADLLFAVVEDFWHQIFHDDLMKMETTISFPQFFKDVFERLQKNLAKFQNGLLKQLSLLNSTDKDKGHQIEAATFRHMQQGFCECLRQDKRIDSKLWTSAFTVEDFAYFAFQNMMSLLRTNAEDCEFFIEVLIRLLY